MLMFSESEVKRFHHGNKNLRWGQAFYEHFKLEKISSPEDKRFCDKLHNANDEVAKAMVASRTMRGQ